MIIKEVIRNINRGGFGDIDEVLCDDGYHYARKTFSPAPQFSGNPQLCEKLKKRFIREVKTQKILPDEYFIPIVFDNLDSETPWFLMPLADKVYTEEIADSKREGRNPEGLGDILNGLEFLHDKQLVHRDLKPQNILKHNNLWKLADFGLISQDKEILSQTITTSNNAYGTVMYCAPEQVVEFNRITPQADIFSFGAILHDIFTDGSRVPYSELSTDGEIGQIINKCTKHRKENRFRNIKTLRTRLLTLLSKGNTSIASGTDLQWQTDFEDAKNWKEDKFENFIFYLKQNDSVKGIIFHTISEDILDYFKSIDRHLFSEFAIEYLDWIYQQSFTYDYCDVVVGNIFFIYNNTSDVEVKTKCAISGARLGYYHNRWYVMRYVVRMANSDIDDNLAFRISMEIELNERDKNNFKGCVRQISLTTSAYHQQIKDIL